MCTELYSTRNNETVQRPTNILKNTCDGFHRHIESSSGKSIGLSRRWASVNREKGKEWIEGCKIRIPQNKKYFLANMDKSIPAKLQDCRLIRS